MTTVLCGRFNSAFILFLPLFPSRSRMVTATQRRSISPMVWYHVAIRIYTIALFAVLYLWERGRTPASQFLFTRILAILVVVLHICFLCQYIQVCTSSRIDVHFASLINHPRSTVQFKNRYSKGCCHLRGHIHCAHNVFRNSPSRIFFLTDPFEFEGRLGLLLFSIQRSQ